MLLQYHENSTSSSVPIDLIMRSLFAISLAKVGKNVGKCRNNLSSDVFFLS